VVCASVRSGAPPLLIKPFTWKSLTRHAREAAGPTQRTVVSLGRLERLGDRQALAALVDAYTQLRAAYGAVRGAAAGSGSIVSLGSKIVTQEQAVSAVAGADGLPACGIAGA
jgi:hypothetical protein